METSIDNSCWIEEPDEWESLKDIQVKQSIVADAFSCEPILNLWTCLIEIVLQVLAIRYLREQVLQHFKSEFKWIFQQNKKNFKKVLNSHFCVFLFSWPNINQVSLVCFSFYFCFNPVQHSLLILVKYWHSL